MTWSECEGATFCDKAKVYYENTDEYLFDLLHGSRSKAWRKQVYQHFGHWKWMTSIGPDVIEFGGGLGLTCSLLRDEGRRVTYCDVDGPAAKFARWYFERTGQRDIEILHTPSSELVLPEGRQWDLVFSDSVIEHVPDPAATVERLARALKPGGRAAVVLPDNVLFEGNVGKQIRADLMDKCNLHTILRLPTGIFYAQGVKTNVLFFTRGTGEKCNTKEVWVYNLRANMPAFGKRTPLTREHFAEFEAAYGSDPLGLAPRTATGPDGRWQCFSREEITARGDSLDLAWLKDDSAEDGADLPEPATLAQEAMQELEGALEDLRAILAELGEEVEELV